MVLHRPFEPTRETGRVKFWEFKWTITAFTKQNLGISPFLHRIGQLKVLKPKTTQASPAQHGRIQNRRNEISFSIYGCSLGLRPPCAPTYRTRRVFEGRSPPPRSLRCLGCIQDRQTCKQSSTWSGCRTQVNQ